MSSKTFQTKVGLNRNRTGLIVGGFTGGWHVLWSLLVGIGVAQAFLDWVYRLHFLNNPFRVAEFNIVTAGWLFCISFSVGYLMGSLFALLWNVLLPQRQANADLMSRAA